VKFYFDFISPYAWLAWRPLVNLVQKYSSLVTFQPIPILFAGLLNAHGQLGPAEIPPKRLWLIKDIIRRAKLQNLQVNPPPTHPFNPLLSLRIASIDSIHSEMKIKLISEFFDAIWIHGYDISDTLVIQELLEKKLNYSLEEINEIFLKAKNEKIKNKLRDETNEAIQRYGVFGVPTTLVDEELFWGSESETIEMINKAIQRERTVMEMNENEIKIIQRWETIKKSADRRERKN
jgi:2-hydroxychromene-2-carboxylate isomerase